VTVLYIILAVIAVLVCAAVFVLVSPLSVRIVYREELEVFAGLSFIRFKIFPKKEKRTKIKAFGKQKHLKEKNTDKSGNKSKSQKTAEVCESNKATDAKQSKKSIKEMLTLILDIVKSVFQMMGKRASLGIYELRVVVSKPDAADTAVQFALCEGIVSTLLALSSEFAKSEIRDENISVCPDFVTGKSSLRVDISISVPAGALLLSIVKGYLKNQFR